VHFPLFELVPCVYLGPLLDLEDTMAVKESQKYQDGVTPLKTKGEIDIVRLEAALGHKQELKRNFGLWSLTSLGIVIAKYVNIVVSTSDCRDI
jgi:hypothetical protein